MKMLAKYYEENKKWLILAMLSVFLWGMLAHAYGFLDNSFSHDSLNELQSAIFGNNLKMGSGRVLTPIYRDLIRGDVTVPWLIGILALGWTGLAVFLTVRVLGVESKITIFLIAGIFTVNNSVSACVATYIHDYDCYMFAVMCTVGAVFLWKTFSNGWLWGSILLAATLGIYQSYLFIAATLVVIVSILDLMNGAKGKQVLVGGGKAIGMALLGGAAYFLMMKGLLYLDGEVLRTNDYNSLDVVSTLTWESLPYLVQEAYSNCLRRLWEAGSTYPSVMVKGITLGMAVISAGALLTWFADPQSGVIEKVMGMMLVVILPLVMNMIYILANRYIHDLMAFPVWLSYLLAILLADWLFRKSVSGKWRNWLRHGQRYLCVFLLGLLLYGNVQFANGMYLKKDLEYDAYLSLMTRVVGRMESCEGYIPGETPVIFIGLPSDMLNTVAPGFKDYWNVTGMLHGDIIYMPERERYRAYFDYVLGVPMTLAEGEVWTQGLNSEFAEQMEKYPAQGCVALKDGVLYVKLGDRGTDREE